MYKKFTKNIGIVYRYTPKILRIMKIVTIILLVTIMQVSASTFAQKITYAKKDATLEMVFKEIMKQTNFRVLWNSERLKNAKSVDVAFKNEPIEKVLEMIMSNQPVTYTIRKNTVVVMQKPSLLEKAFGFLANIDISGKVTDDQGNPLPRAVIRYKNGGIAGTTNDKGEFVIRNQNDYAILVISYVGFKTQEVTVTNEKSTNLMITMLPDINQLEKVDVVSTGYQTLPKERATGSFEKIDNHLFNRNVSTDVISRLDGLVSSIQFDKRSTRSANLTGMNIRGLSTLYANTVPLVVLDNFPYDGDINNINPNDVESISILKDAAAASIWGVRAGNGVIVITTKKSSLDQALKVTLSSNVTIEEKPDLMGIPIISTSGYIDVEKMLYAKGFYNSTINNKRSFPVVSPVVELLIQNNDAARAQIEALKQNDIRTDFLKYVYREPVRQQYAFSLSRGNKSLSYLISVGYDKNLGNIINSNQDRLSLRANTTFVPIRNLEIQTNVLYTQNRQNRIGNNSNIAYGSIRSSSTRNIYPYSHLADGSGNPLVIPKDYRNSFIQANSGIGLLDWTYNPLNDINDSYNKSKANDLLLNLNANYKINTIFSADIKYQYERTNSTGDNYQGLGTYYTRNLINRYTQINGGQIINNIPIGGILSKANGDFDSYNVRGQLNANKVWNGKHQLSAIAGVELKQNHSTGNGYLTYGYDPNILTFQNVDFVNTYPIYRQLSGDRSIPNDASFSDILNRYTSIYANAAYTYNNLYTISLSARKDASNLFGVNANQRGVPLWSSGLSWNISNEDFYKIDWLPYLKLRSTYGYNGNLNTNLSAYTIIRNTGINPVTNLPYADVISPPNPSLRWEKIGIANFGLDFGVKGNHVTGSFEYYIKSAKDLLAQTPIESTTGVSLVTRNSANLRARGVDLTINGANRIGDFIWNSTFIYSYAQNKVVKYLQKFPTGSSYVSTGSLSSINPIEGKPAYSIFAYKWAGLDPQTGDPQGYLNGKVSKDYFALSNVGVDDLEYIGSAIPSSFGAFRNTIGFKSFAISANVTYKFGYYFRRQPLSYGTLFTNGIGTSDFDKRWQKTGDEATTNVPSMIYPNNGNRDSFYAGSTALVEKGDHIRLQDISLSYSFVNPQLHVRNLRVFFNVNNVGIIWRANKLHIDPDYDSSSYPAQKTFSFGLNADF